jgi:hypothetical protein
VSVCYAEYRGRTVKGFINYILAEINRKYRYDSYQYYITDCLYVLARVDRRWYDIINPVEEKDQLQTALDNFYSDFKGKGDKK